MTSKMQTITPKTIYKYCQVMSESPKINVIKANVMGDPCNPMRFPARDRLSAEELDDCVRFSMYPQYNSFYVWWEDTNEFVFLLSVTTKLHFFGGDVDSYFEGSFEEGWTIKDFEKVKCMCDAYDYASKDKHAWKEKREREEKESMTKDGEPKTKKLKSKNKKKDFDLSKVMKMAPKILSMFAGGPPSGPSNGNAHETSVTSGNDMLNMLTSLGSNGSPDDAMVDLIGNMAAELLGDVLSPESSDSNSRPPVTCAPPSASGLGDLEMTIKKIV